MDTIGIGEGLCVRINPLQLIVGEARVQSEFFFNNENSCELILSYIFSGSDVSSSGYSNQSSGEMGGKIGFAYRHYFSTYERGGNYLNPLLFYKYIYYPNVETNTPLGVKTNEVRYHIVSLQLQHAIYRPWIESDNILIDYYWGLGVRYKYGVAFQESTRPEVVIPAKRVIESWFYPSIHLGCTIGYKFYKTKK